MDTEFWEKQWNAIEAAPVIYAIGVALIAAAVWWLRGFLARNEIDALKAQLAAKDERLTLAHERAEGAKTEFQKLKAEMDGALRYWRDMDASPSPPLFPDLDRMLSTSVHSVNLDRLLTDVSSATTLGSPLGRSILS